MQSVNNFLHSHQRISTILGKDKYFPSNDYLVKCYQFSSNPKFVTVFERESIKIEMRV